MHGRPPVCRNSPPLRKIAIKSMLIRYRPPIIEGIIMEVTKIQTKIRSPERNKSLLGHSDSRRKYFRNEPNSWHLPAGHTLMRNPKITCPRLDREKVENCCETNPFFSVVSVGRCSERRRQAARETRHLSLEIYQTSRESASLTP